MDSWLARGAYWLGFSSIQMLPLRSCMVKTILCVQAAEFIPVGCEVEEIAVRRPIGFEVVRGPIGNRNPFAAYSAATDLLFLKGAATTRGRGIDVHWLYYVVEHAWVVRVSDDWARMEILQADGTWLPDTNVGWVQKDGRKVQNEAEALEEAREIFDLRGVPHSL